MTSIEGTGTYEPLAASNKWAIGLLVSIFLSVIGSFGLWMYKLDTRIYDLNSTISEMRGIMVSIQDDLGDIKKDLNKEIDELKDDISRERNK